MFKDCVELKDVKFGDMQVVAAANAFYNCGKLTSIELQGVDFSTCDTMLQMFQGCASLTLDCSEWDTTKCEDITNFNNGAPGVKPPILNG